MAPLEVVAEAAEAEDGRDKEAGDCERLFDLRALCNSYLVPVLN